ncbi:unnamed protein product, partial [Sphacelaria rigidula]
QFCGVAYFHDHRVLHGDVKLAHAVLDVSCQSVKLIDFGFGKILERGLL